MEEVDYSVSRGASRLHKSLIGLAIASLVTNRSSSRKAAFYQGLSGSQAQGYCKA